MPLPQKRIRFGTFLASGLACLEYTEAMQEKFYGLPIDHIGIAVQDVEAASAPYLLIGCPHMHEDEIIVEQQVKVRALQAGDGLLELLEPTTETSPIAKFIAKKGAGLHHIALRVEDIRAEIARLQAEGARFINDEPRAGRAGTQVAFLHPKWTGGVLLELVQHT